MAQFPNMTFAASHFPPMGNEAVDMQHLRDVVAAAGSGRAIYSPYYNNGYYPMGWRMSSVGDVVLGVAVVGAVIFVIYWIFAVLMRLHRHYYYGLRKKRSTDDETINVTNPNNLFGGVAGKEEWRTGRMLKVKHH